MLTVRFDNPPLNFMDRVMVAELDHLLDDLEGERSIGAVVLTGKPQGMFITHYDVEEILKGSEGVGRSMSAGVAGASLQTVDGVARLPGARAALGRTLASGLLELKRMHDVLPACSAWTRSSSRRSTAPALGGGCEISLACDLRYMAAEAEMIGLPEMTLGFCPGGGGTQRLSQLLGPSRALEMILEGRALSPTEAPSSASSHRVVAERDLATESRATAERLARRAPLSIEAAKRAILDGATKPLDQGLADERKWFMATVSQPAARRAMRAYAERAARGGPALGRTPKSGRMWQDGTAVDLVSEG